MKLIKYSPFLLLLLSFNSFGQSISQCNSTVTRVETGSQFGTAVALSDSAACGAAGFVCIADSDDTSTATNRIYAAALTAQATGADVIVRWDGSVRGCGALNLPTAVQFIVQPAAVN